MDLSVWRENVKSCQLDSATGNNNNNNNNNGNTGNNRRRQQLELGQRKRVSPCRSCTCTMEGLVCKSIKINCMKAMKQSSASVMADKWCVVQCAWALEMPQIAGAARP